MSSTDLVTPQPTKVLSIPAVVSVRAPDQETAESVASDLLALQVFGAVRIDDGSISDYDLLAIYKPRSAAHSGWFCGEPDAMVLLSVLSLMITPSCVIERGYELELLPNGSVEVIRVEPEYESTTWMGLHTILMNISPNWQWGAPDDEVRRQRIQSAISKQREDILRSLNLEPVRPAGRIRE